MKLAESCDVDWVGAQWQHRASLTTVAHKRGRSGSWPVKREWKLSCQRRRCSRRLIAGTDLACFFRRVTIIITTGCSQLLHATFTRHIQSQILANNAVHRGVMNTSFSDNLACWSMRLWRVFLTEDKIINCVDVIIYPLCSRSSTAASSRCATGVSEFFSNLFSELKANPLSGNSLISFFCTVTFKNV